MAPRPPPKSDGEALPPSLRGALRGDAGRGLRDDEIELGYVSGVFGVAGEVRLFLHHRESDLLTRPRSILLVDEAGHRYAARLVVRTGAGKRVLGAIEGLTDRDGAAALQGWRVAIPAAALPALPEGEFYLWQVEGAEARVGGEPVGVVVEVHQTEGGELLELEIAGEQVFVPCVAGVVLGVDRDARVVHLAPDALDEG